ncbi:MAG: radical SAM protein [Chlorobi bacterium]|nr:radical SAM protein [Chlorobiota bacterium]
MAKSYSIVFSVTYDCPVSCKYCVTRSGPFGGPFLDAAFMREVIETLDRYLPLSLAVFTGGEPLLKMHDVEEAIAFASARGMGTRVVTNAFWATTAEKARNILGRLQEKGLSEINFSCDDLHQEFIPLANLRHAFRAAKEIGMPLLIAHKRVVGTRITPEYLGEFLGVHLSEFKPGRTAQDGENLYSSSLTVPVGHGCDLLREEDYIIYPESPAAWSSPCCSVLESLVISPSGELRICCGMMEQHVPELGAGFWDASRIAELLETANSDLIANWLALEGPYGIRKFILEKNPSIAFRERYVNHCHLCNDIFTRTETREVLASFAEEKAAELTIRRGILEAVRHDRPNGKP